MPDWTKNVPLQLDITPPLKFKRRYFPGSRFRSANCLRISPPLKKLSKVSVRCHSEEYLLDTFFENYYQRVCGGFYIY